MFFSVMTKNLNWKISTKNLVTFKGWGGVWKKFFFRGGGGGGGGGSESAKKRGAWIVWKFKSGLGKKEKKKG